MKITLNATVLSVFGKLSKINVLEKILEGNEVIVPTQVLSEYSLIENKDEIPSSFKIKEIGIRETSNLGKGESACIEISKKEKAIFVSDDLRARKIAEEDGIKVTGSLGLIITGVKKSKISKDEAKEVVNEIYFRKLLYISESLYKDVLLKIGQSKNSM